jgi:hypothetical protein
MDLEQDTSNFPQFTAGVAKEENEQVNIHTKLQLGGKMYMDGGVAVNEDVRYNVPSLGVGMT